MMHRLNSEDDDYARACFTGFAERYSDARTESRSGELQPGIRGDEHVAILGPNGCGKSTLIKTITRECYPVAQEGSSMTILGQDRWDVFELRSLLGIVSNDLMSKCTGEACGRDVVLSGFFSSARIFPHHAGRSKAHRTGR